jgi:hypothetical protein
VPVGALAALGRTRHHHEKASKVAKAYRPPGKK